MLAGTLLLFFFLPAFTGEISANQIQQCSLMPVNFASPLVTIIISAYHNNILLHHFHLYLFVFLLLAHRDLPLVIVVFPLYLHAFIIPVLSTPVFSLPLLLISFLQSPSAALRVLSL